MILDHVHKFALDASQTADRFAEMIRLARRNQRSNDDVIPLETRIFWVYELKEYSSFNVEGLRSTETFA